MRDRLAEPHLARDIGAALAAGLDQFAGDVAAILEHVDQRAKALGQAGLQSGMGEHEAKRLRQAAIDLLEVMFELDVVGQIELADPRGIAAAAQILEQQRVIQFPQLEFADPDLLTDLRADEAAAHAMPGRLAFGHVERVAERAQQFGEPDIAGGRRGSIRRNIVGHRGVRQARAKKQRRATEARSGLRSD